VAGASWIWKWDFRRIAFRYKLAELRTINSPVQLRELKQADANILAALANDYEIWKNVRDHFPHPYTLEHAKHFITEAISMKPPVTFAIEFNSKFVGVIGIKPQIDIYRRSGEVGYWIGKPHQGHGIATMALALITEYGLNVLNLNRLFAGVFSNNAASIRVLEKCGYLHEGTHKDAVWKNHRFLDEHRYGFVQTLSPNLHE